MASTMSKLPVLAAATLGCLGIGYHFLVVKKKEPRKGKINCACGKIEIALHQPAANYTYMDAPCLGCGCDDCVNYCKKVRIEKKINLFLFVMIFLFFLHFLGGLIVNEFVVAAVVILFCRSVVRKHRQFFLLSLTHLIMIYVDVLLSWYRCWKLVLAI